MGDEHGIEIDENAIDRIEIIKGPGSLAFLGLMRWLVLLIF